MRALRKQQERLTWHINSCTMAEPTWEPGWDHEELELPSEFPQEKPKAKAELLGLHLSLAEVRVMPLKPWVISTLQTPKPKPLALQAPAHVEVSVVRPQIKQEISPDELQKAHVPWPQGLARDFCNGKGLGIQKVFGLAQGRESKVTSVVHHKPPLPK